MTLHPSHTGEFWHKFSEIVSTTKPLQKKKRKEEKEIDGLIPSPVYFNYNNVYNNTTKSSNAHGIDLVHTLAQRAQAQARWLRPLVSANVLQVWQVQQLSSSKALGRVTWVLHGEAGPRGSEIKCGIYIFN